MMIHLSILLFLCWGGGYKLYLIWNGFLLFVFFIFFVRRTIESDRGVFRLFEVDDNRIMYAEVQI